MARAAGRRARDILPAGDVGIRRAIRDAWELDALPSIEQTRERATAWAPQRTYAAALLWTSLVPADADGSGADPRA